MSKPIKYSISSELISAMSALNTEVTYEGQKRKDDELVFISDAEPLAKHSIEHMHAAVDIAQDIKSDLSDIKAKFTQTLKKLGVYDDLSFHQLNDIDKVIRQIEQKL